MWGSVFVTVLRSWTRAISRISMTMPSRMAGKTFSFCRRKVMKQRVIMGRK